MLRRGILTFAAVLHLFLLDQIVKAAAVYWLKDGLEVVVLKRFFSLKYAENRGCAWGMLQGHVWLLAVFAAVALALFVWKRRAIFPPGRWGVAAEVMLYAGIIGNLVDRLWRGHVVDMFFFHWDAHEFPVFNVADSFITVAAGILIAFSFFVKGGDDPGRNDAA